MIRNYFVIAYRSLLRDKFNSFINLSGLTIGLACSILIYFYVKDEITFDTFHSNHERIFRIHVSENYDTGDSSNNTVSPIPTAKTLKEHYSQIEASTIFGTNTGLLRYGETSLRELYAFGGQDFFKIFDFSVKKGSLINIFQNSSDAVLTNSQAQKMFNDNDPIGESFELLLGDQYRTFTVKAVIADVPGNSSLQFSTLISSETLKYTVSPSQMKSWFFVFTETYVMLGNDDQLSRIEATLPEFVDQYIPKSDGLEEYTIGFQSLTDIHLNTDFDVGVVEISDPKYVYILSFIAFFILIIACINFTTLNIGKSVDRAKEIGVRKVNGAYRYSLITQFLVEALFMTFLAMSAGVLLGWFLLDPFNDIASKSLVFQLNWADVMVLIGFTVLVAVASGAYPALILSSFDPIRAFRGKVVLGQGKQFLRKSLVGAQFVISLFMISCTLLVMSQLNFLQEKNLGFSQEAIVSIPMNVPFTGGIVSFLEEGMQDGARFNNVIKSLPEIQKVSVSTNTFAEGAWINIGFKTNENIKKKFKYNCVGPGYLETMGIELKEGSDISVDDNGKGLNGLIVNEAFVKEFGLENPIGTSVFTENFGPNSIIGVVKDFHFESLHNRIEPLVLSRNVKAIFKGAGDLWLESDITPKAFVSLSAGQTQQGINKIEKVWEEFYPGAPFEFQFLDQKLAQQYESEINLGRVVKAATIVAILISCLGLLSLATLTINGRIKEIGIRKVLGAPLSSLLLMLSKEYFILIVLSALVSVPLVVLFMDNWLSNFAYRIDVGALPFILGFGLMAIIACSTVGYRVIRAALLNPAITLKDE